MKGLTTALLPTPPLHTVNKVKRAYEKYNNHASYLLGKIIFSNEAENTDTNLLLGQIMTAFILMLNFSSVEFRKCLITESSITIKFNPTNCT